MPNFSQPFKCINIYFQFQMDYNFSNPYTFPWTSAPNLYMPNGFANSNPSAQFNTPRPVVPPPPGFPNSLYPGHRFPGGGNGIFPFGMNESYNNIHQWYQNQQPNNIVNNNGHVVSNSVQAMEQNSQGQSQGQSTGDKNSVQNDTTKEDSGSKINCEEIAMKVTSYISDNILQNLNSRALNSTIDTEMNTIQTDQSNDSNDTENEEDDDDDNPNNEDYNDKSKVNNPSERHPTVR